MSSQIPSPRQVCSSFAASTMSFPRSFVHPHGKLDPPRSFSVRCVWCRRGCLLMRGRGRVEWGGCSDHVTHTKTLSIAWFFGFLQVFFLPPTIHQRPTTRTRASILDVGTENYWRMLLSSQFGSTVSSKLSPSLSFSRQTAICSGSIKSEATTGPQKPLL